MAGFSGFSSHSGLTDVLQCFSRQSEHLLRLVDAIMCANGALSRGEREAIAAFVSQQFATPYCVLFHTVFSEAFSGPVAAMNATVRPLLTYAEAILDPDADHVGAAFEAARNAGRSVEALYEVVDLCDLLSFINTIVRAAGMEPPEAIT